MITFGDIERLVETPKITVYKKENYEKNKKYTDGRFPDIAHIGTYDRDAF